MNVVEAPRLKLVTKEKTLETMEMSTIEMSNLLPLSRKYTLGPNAINLSMASIKKMRANP